MNKTILTGNVTRDAEHGVTGGGTDVIKFSIANNIKQGGQEKTLFMDCVLYGKRAVALQNYVKKGVKVLVEGVLEEQRWEKNGETKKKMVLTLSDIDLLGGKRSDAPQEETTLEPF